MTKRDELPPSPTTEPPGLDRRRFLQCGLALSVGGLIGARARAAGPAPKYKVTGFLGDAYEGCHKVRDGELGATPATSGKHEVVVVGAGIAGMTAAFKLRQLDTLVLDQAPRIGGNSQAERRGPHEFNIGAAYFTGNDGAIAELWGELGLDVKPVEGPTDRWFLRDKWITSPWHDEGIAATPPDVQRPMAALKKALQALVDSPDFPNTPYHTATPKALELDKITFAEWLKPYAQPDLMAFIESYCFSAMGGSMQQLSAFGGLNFYSEFLGDIYAYPEGNYRIIKELAAAFAKAGAGRVATGCTVYRIDPLGDDGARVCYLQDGEAKAVEARRVVLAAPYYIAGRLISGLADSQRYLLGMPGYGAYPVFNMVFDKVISLDSYDSWVPSARRFDDFIPATWCDRQKQAELEAANAGQVIALFACTRRPQLGRYRMMTAKPEEFARPVVEAFERLYPGATEHLQEVLVTRWGHAIIINRPGMYTRWLPRIDKQIGPVHLAHGDGQALPALESSTQEAMAAAQRVLSGWKRKTAG